MPYQFLKISFVLFWNVARVTNIRDSGPHYYKLRKQYTLQVRNYILNFSNFTWCTVFMICRYLQYVHSKPILKFWLIIKTSSEVISVWNFDLRIFSVYGHEAVYNNDLDVKMYLIMIFHLFCPVVMKNQTQQHW